MKNDKSKLWADFTPEEYVDSILKRDADSASIAYYLVDKQLRIRLKSLFVNLGGENHLEFQDTIDDFFLYLHDGSNWLYNRPFYVLESIENKGSLFKWLAMTYRNFLIRQLNEERRRKSACEEIAVDVPEIKDEEKIRNLSTAIAYADQQSLSRNRFVMYRLLLTFLNKSLAIPQEEMAQVVDMQPVAYRVSTKRAKDNILSYIKCLEEGRKLELDNDHKKMRDVISENFDNLYSILERYYNNAINQLPTADAIKKLRFGYRCNNNYEFHEETQPYGLCNSRDIGYIYMCIKEFCLRNNDV